MLESLQELDEQVLLALNGLRAPFWDGFMWTVSETWTWVAMYAAILYVVCRNFSWRVAAVAVVAVVAVIVFADQLGASVIRPAVGRLRPSNLENPVSEFVQILNGKRGGRYGFPSCHAANSFGLAFITLLLFRRWGVGVFLLFWATLNSYSRIPRGALSRRFGGGDAAGGVGGCDCVRVVALGIAQPAGDAVAEMQRAGQGAHQAHRAFPAHGLGNRRRGTDHCGSGSVERRANPLNHTPPAASQIAIL